MVTFSAIVGVIVGKLAEFIGELILILIGGLVLYEHIWCPSHWVIHQRNSVTKMRPQSKNGASLFYSILQE